MSIEPRAPHVAVERLMHEIEDDVRRVRRTRALARGGPADYEDAAIYASVDAALRRALVACDRDALLLPDLLDSDEDWRLDRPLRFSSHRPFIGPVLIFIKRRLLLPLTRWLFDYTQQNLKRQERVNHVLFACIEALAIENAKLRRGQEGQERQEGSARGHATARPANPSASIDDSARRGWGSAASVDEAGQKET